MSEARLCSKCQREPAEPRQRWGRHCFTAYQRTRKAAKMLRARGEEAQPGALESQAPHLAPVGEKDPPVNNALSNARNNRASTPTTRPTIAPEWIYEAPERFVPFRDTPDHGPAWAGTFLSDYSVHGGQPLAAARAGVTMKTVEREERTDPIFAEEVKRALEYHRALLEWESLNLGRCKHSPLPFFDRLKAELPERHVDKNLSVSLNMSAELSSADVLPALQHMLANATDETKAMLSGQVIKGLPALPEAEPSQ